MKEQKEINPYIKANPVYHTKEPELYNLVRAEVEEAITLNEYLKFYVDLYNKRIINAQSLFQEVRYRFVNHYIDLHKDEVILDLGCGFSPRGLKYADEGREYIGFDLENCVNLIDEATTKAINDKDKCKLVKYIACDVSNTVVFAKSCQDIKKPVILVCEGLLMYLRKYELDAFLESLKQVLLAHGGRFITLDFSVNKLMKACFDNLAGKHFTFKMLKESRKAQLKYSGANKDELDPSKWYGVDNDGDSFAEQFFLSHGLSIKRIPIYVDSIHLNVLEKLDPKVRQKVVESLKCIAGWEVTLEEKDSNRLHKNDSLSNIVSKHNEFKIYENLVGNDLTYTISGHLDSITAVQLLESFEKYSNLESLKNIDIDVSKLEYLSSAGLRVLLIMKKRCNGGKVILRNPTILVSEILETSGFDNFVEIVR